MLVSSAPISDFATTHWGYIQDYTVKPQARHYRILHDETLVRCSVNHEYYRLMEFFTLQPRAPLAELKVRSGI